MQKDLIEPLRESDVELRSSSKSGEPVCALFGSTGTWRVSSILSLSKACPTLTVCAGNQAVGYWRAFRWGARDVCGLVHPRLTVELFAGERCKVEQFQGVRAPLAHFRHFCETWIQVTSEKDFLPQSPQISAWRLFNSCLIQSPMEKSLALSLQNETSNTWVYVVTFHRFGSWRCQKAVSG